MKYCPESTTCILILCIALSGHCLSEVPKITSDKIHHIRYVPDNIHRFIFVDNVPTQEQMKSFPTGHDIEYYYVSCSDEEKIFRICQKKKQLKTLIILAYNKMFIQYQIHLADLTLEYKFKQVKQWVQQVHSRNMHKDLKEQQILSLLAQNKQLVIICQNKTIQDFQNGAKMLAKEMYFLDIIYLSDNQHAPKYGLEISDIAYLKIRDQNPSFQNGDLQKIIKNTTITTILIKQAPKRYDIMKLFTLQNLYSRGFSKELQGLEKNRFQIKVRKPDQNGNYQQHRRVIVGCDLSRPCLKYMKNLDQQILQSGSQYNGNTKINRIFVRQQSKRNIEVIQIYYHLKINNKKLPYVFVFDGEDPTVPHLPVRYIKELQISNQDGLGEITEFLKNIDEQKIQKISMSSGILKKNGFTGKGSQKFIQKLSYQTYKSALALAKQKKQYYFLFITASQFQCPQCSEFYAQIKKLASFLNAQNSLNVTFGMFDLSKDQIDYPQLNSIPSILFFSPHEQSPKPYQNRYEFESVLRFLKQQIHKSEQKAKNSNKKVEKQQINQQL